MRCERCQGCGIEPWGVERRPCKDCGGSGISHCCDGIQEQRDPGDETAEFHENPIIDALLTEASDGALETLWADQLGEMERDVTGCADDCCHPSHDHEAWRREMLERIAKPNRLVAYLKRNDPDTHDEWRKLNDE